MSSEVCESSELSLELSSEQCVSEKLSSECESSDKLSSELNVEESLVCTIDRLDSVQVRELSADIAEDIGMEVPNAKTLLDRDRNLDVK